MRQKHIFIALFGTFLEYFDYALYGFSAVVIANSFFPPADESTMLIQTFGVFAIGHFAKPLGAIIFGYIGDKYGRKRALKYNMLGIAIPTMMIGLMPVYADWGAWSVFFLICCRFTQGFFVSGEYDGVVLYVVEHFKEKQKCFANSLICMISMTGFVIASYTVMQLRQFGPDFETTLWRMPFIVGGLLGLIMLFLRRYLLETPFFNVLSSAGEEQKFSFKTLKQQAPLFILFIIMFGATGGLYHFTFVFFEKFIMMQHFFNEEILSKYHFYGLLCFVLFDPIAGMCGDRWGAKLSAMVGLIFLALSWIVFACYHAYLISYYGIWLASVAIGMSLFCVQIHIIAIETVNKYFRYRLINLGHTTGAMLLSGTAPVYAMFLYQKFEQPILVYLYPLVMIAGIFLAIIAMKSLAIRVSRKAVF